MQEPLSFSARNRAADIAKLQTGNTDLIVIGGGITGAGIALDAASRGLKVVLAREGRLCFGYE